MRSSIGNSRGRRELATAAAGVVPDIDCWPGLRLKRARSLMKIICHVNIDGLFGPLPTAKSVRFFRVSRIHVV
jgi:hypothetical protein